MVFTGENILLLGAVLVFISIIISKTGFRFGVPTLLLFLLTGMMFGSDGMGLEFNSPESAQFIGMIALSIILFTGGMDTKFAEIKPIAVPGLILSTLALLITTILTGAFIYCLAMISGMNFNAYSIPSCRHNVIYRLGIGVQHPPFPENEPQAQS